MLIRAHQVVMGGYLPFADDYGITLFSASNYCYREKNRAALLEIDEELVVYPKVLLPDLRDVK
jgi:hypothetical protein